MLATAAVTTRWLMLGLHAVTHCIHRRGVWVPCLVAPICTIRVVGACMPAIAFGTLFVAGAMAVAATVP